MKTENKCHNFNFLDLIIRRNRVHTAATAAWPGNSIPLVKGKGEAAVANKAALLALVEKLVPDCCRLYIVAQPPYQPPYRCHIW